jgi:hypothetical protein
MPSNNSWNGRWSGDEKLFAVVRNIGTAKKTLARYQPIIEKGYYTFHFGDGWVAAIHVYTSTNPDEVRKIRKRSQGFCGYEWMIDSIIQRGEISVDVRRMSA